MTPKDTGARTVLSTGSLKEIIEGRGRYDLIPLSQLSKLFMQNTSELLIQAEIQLNKGNLKRAEEIYGEVDYLLDIAVFIDLLHRSMNDKSIKARIKRIQKAITVFVNNILKSDLITVTKKLAKSYEYGAKKYSERDWEKGRPQSVFIDSTLRHFFQYLNNENDEDHATAVVWNLISCADTLDRLPEMAFNVNRTKGE